MSNKIITYSLCDDFIIKLADYLQDHYLKSGRDLSRLAVVFGGRRPALFLKKELARRVGGVFLPPRFFTIDEFMDELVLRDQVFKGISELDAGYLIYQLAGRHTPEVLAQRRSFARFLPWAREILAFIEQLDLEDIQSPKLENIQLKAAIGYDVPESINRLLAGIITLREAFHQMMRQRGEYSRGFRYLQASRLAERSALPEYEEIIFAGFFYLHATERVVMRHMQARGQGTLIFQGSGRQWSVLKEHLRFFGAGDQESDEQYLRHRPAVAMCAGFDVHAQAALARHACASLPTQDSSVIVAPLPENIIPLVSEIAGVCDEFNVSMGYPLSRSALYSLFRSILKAQETRKRDAYYTRDYLNVLSHPLVKSIRFFSDPALTRIMVHKIEEILLGIEETPIGGSSFIRLDELQGLSDLYDLFMDTAKTMGFEVGRDEVKSALGTLHSVLFSGWSMVRDLAGFAAHLEACLDLLAGRSAIGRFPLNITMAQRLLQLCEEFRHAAFSTEAFPAEEIFRIFRDAMEQATIRFTGSPLKGVQILGALETRSLSFKNLIMIDVNESVVPALTVYEPLIPREVMIHLGLNRLEKEEEIQRYQFRRLIAGARQVTLIYQNSPDKEKSRFIEELIWERQQEQRSLGPCVITHGAFTARVLSERLRMPKDEQILARLRSLSYSASSINTYLDCSLRFYYQYVLGLREKEDLLDEPEAADIGCFMHDLLEEALRPCIGRRPKIDHEFVQEVLRIRDARFGQVFSRTMKSDAFLLKGVVDLRVEQFLENERRRSVQRIIGLEKEVRGVLRLQSGEFQVQARIDRIDQLEDEVMVLDYKTGSTDLVPVADLERLQALSPDRASIKRLIKSFQLPLYVYLAGQQFRRAQVINAGLYSLRDMSENFGINALFRKPKQVAQRQEILSCYFKALDALFAELLDPAVPFHAEEEQEHACRHCPFFYLCR